MVAIANVHVYDVVKTNRGRMPNVILQMHTKVWLLIFGTVFLRFTVNIVLFALNIWIKWCEKWFFDVNFLNKNFCWFVTAFTFFRCKVWKNVYILECICRPSLYRSIVYTAYRPIILSFKKSKKKQIFRTWIGILWKRNEIKILMEISQKIDE